MNSSVALRRATSLVLTLSCASFFACTSTTDNGSPGTGGAGSGKGGSGGGGAAKGGSGGSASTGTGGAVVSTGGSGVASGGSSGSGAGGAGSGGKGGSGGAKADGPSGSGGKKGDAAGGETPPAAGAGCQGVTAKFCDDWEMQEAGKPPVGEFTISVAGGGSIVVDTAQKFSGAKSLHVKGGGKAMLVFTKQFPLTNEHGRLMLYMPKKPTTGAHWDIIQSRATNNTHWEFGGQAGVFELVVDPPDNGIDSATSFPEGDKWFCVQWNFAAPGIMSAKLDGELVKPSPVVNRWKADAWRDLTVGWEIFGSSAADFFIDDLAFGDAEIPCPAK